MVDVLSKILQKVTIIGLTEQVGLIHHHLCCLQYAYDTLILVPTDTPSLINIKIILVLFEIMTGLKINYLKSLIYKISSLDLQLHNASSILLCQLDTLPFTYLGIPFKTTKLNKCEFISRIGKMRRCLSSWKGNGREKTDGF